MRFSGFAGDVPEHSDALSRHQHVQRPEGIGPADPDVQHQFQGTADRRSEPQVSGLPGGEMGQRRGRPQFGRPFRRVPTRERFQLGTLQRRTVRRQQEQHPGAAHDARMSDIVLHIVRGPQVSEKNSENFRRLFVKTLSTGFIRSFRNSPYKRRINILLSWIDQAGLVLKWNSDVFKYVFYKYKPINPKNYESSKVFSVRDLEIAFIVLSFGLCLSIAVFIVEMLTYKVPKKHKPQPPVHLPFLH